MKGDVARSRIGKHANQRIDGLHHKVYVNRRFYPVISEGFAHHRTNGQVRHIVIVHNIEMNNIGSRR